MVKESAKFFVVGSPIGNLGDMTFRAVEVLKSVDVIFCEDTRHSLKLLNHFGIRKPLKSSPYFKERRAASDLVKILESGQSAAYLCDAGTPNLADPGASLVSEVRNAGYKIEVIGGVSALTYFMAGLGRELESFHFIGFLPPKTGQREKLLSKEILMPTVFFESPHRIETTLQVFEAKKPNARIILAKELSKISEAFFEGTATELLQKVPSWKGEWLGIWFPDAVS